VNGRLEGHRAALAAIPQAAALEAAEAQLRDAEAAVFTLREFIAAAGRDNDFEPAREEARRVLLELNAHCVSIVTSGVGLARGVLKKKGGGGGSNSCYLNVYY
jgi:hypothetical protein